MTGTRTAVPHRAHRFAIGQQVRLRRRRGLSLNVATTYEIRVMLPEQDDCPQYRIRSVDESHERVATEDDLVEVLTEVRSEP